MILRDMISSYTEVDCDWLLYTSDPEGHCKDVFWTWGDEIFVPAEYLDWQIDYMCIERMKIREYDNDLYPVLVLAHDIGYGNEED